MTAVNDITLGILIYAELLSNIRQVSIAVNLGSPSNAETVAEVTKGGTAFRVRHGGLTREVLLPETVAAASALPVMQSTESLSWRLPIPSGLPRESLFSLENQALPWTAVDLRPGSPIICRACGNVFVQSGKITQWKDLPSENWAEMMEFWHCHKPHDHGHANGDAEEAHLTKRGYGASNAISAQEAVGFVDITSFMFTESDCDGILFSSSVDGGQHYDASGPATGEWTKFLNVSCRKCLEQVGLYSIVASSVSLFKWQVSSETKSDQAMPSTAQCLAATLTATISRSGCSKSVVLPQKLVAGGETHGERTLHLWALNPNVTYTSSYTEGKREAMKILYQSIDVEEAEKMAESMTSDVQDITLPKAVIGTALETLESSNSYLPAKDRTFRGWKVGLLSRWSQSDLDK